MCVVRRVALIVLCFAATGLVGAVANASAAVSVFPIPGTRYNRPQTQITFRGIPAGQIGQVQVRGSSSGVHSGHLAPDSDGQGGSFLPDTPFSAGETVTVSSALNVLGASNGTFSFKIGPVLPLIGFGPLPLTSGGYGSVRHYRSRPDLQPASVVVTKNTAPASNGDIFLTPQYGPAQDGPMILDSRGNLLWFLPFPVKSNTLVANLQVQQWAGQPALTWWQGNTGFGLGRGKGVIFDRTYHQVATVKAANGMDMDLHEFLLTPQGAAYVIAANPVQVAGTKKPTIDESIQEIDVASGLVLFDWHALDHIPVSESYFQPKTAGRVFDPYHANSVAIDRDGNLIVSMRNTSAIYKIDHQTGRIIWRLGGKHSSFKMGSGTWGQHDAVIAPDGSLTVFDDGAGPPKVHASSRGIHESLDTTHMTASLLAQFNHSPALSANFEGSVQLLPGGDAFMGWGQQPYFSEDNARGQQDFDAHFVVPADSYRAYRFPWNGQPQTNPALAVWAGGSGAIHLDASWNGAGNVSSWRALGGTSRGSLAPVGSTGKRSFETDVTVHAGLPYFAIQAVDSHGQVLATSSTQAAGRHLAVFGGSAFVAGGSTGGLPAFCYEPRPCHITTTIYAGRTVIGRTGPESLAANGGGILYFRLSSSGVSMLQHNGRVHVHVVVKDVSGTTNGTNMTLVPFYTSGSGPKRSVTNSSNLGIVGETDFVSSGGVGGILAGCFQPTACHVSATISAGGTVISRTGSEYIGPYQLGYVIFNLTSQGKSILARTAGNQLATSVALSAGGSATASANIALVRFS
jgi:Arylsulfotransferase (ASST)